VPEAIVALADECHALSAVLPELEPDEFAKPTNCPPWDLRELVVHIGDSIRVTDTPFTPAEPGDPPVSAADYYRAPRRATPAYRQSNVDRTQSLARTVTVPVVRWFDDVFRHTLVALGRYEPDQVVLIPGRGTMWITRLGHHPADRRCRPRPRRGDHPRSCPLDHAVGATGRTSGSRRSAGWPAAGTPGLG
jgi:hypothetical protein